jgi:hypothetical protein
LEWKMTGLLFSAVLEVVEVEDDGFVFCYFDD